MINILVGNLGESRAMGKGLGLSTLGVFVALVFWGWVLGSVGRLFTVRLTMIVKIVMDGFEETRWLAILLGSNPDLNSGETYRNVPPEWPTVDEMNSAPALPLVKLPVAWSRAFGLGE